MCFFLKLGLGNLTHYYCVNPLGFSRCLALMWVVRWSVGVKAERAGDRVRSPVATPGGDSLQKKKNV